MKEKMLSLPIALAWILGSTFLVTGSAYSLIKMTQGRVVTSCCKETFMIQKIIQTGPHRDALKTDYLAEILELSKDNPTSIFSFDVMASIKKLLAMPMIKEASVFTIKPDTIYVDYTMREPVAMVYDYENIAIDEEGYLFPFSPFYSPKELPEIYFGFSPLAEVTNPFEKPVEGESFTLAMQMLKALKAVAFEGKFFLKRIDVSHAFEKSYGRQEVVVDIANEEFSLATQSQLPFFYHLRLDPKEYAKQLGNYFILHKDLTGSLQAHDERVIDLRIEGLAFIDDK